MDEERVAKHKKRPITYGKAARRQGNGKLFHNEPEDELGGRKEVIAAKSLKPLPRKVMEVSIDIPPASKITTPPSSRSPSLTSPSSVDNKRASPFADDVPGEQKRKIRIVSQDSTRSSSAEIFDQMFPSVAPKKRKPVPKLVNKTRSDLSVSDKTQILLDNQLREPSPPQQVEEPLVVKKAGLKMPTRTRGMFTSTLSKDNDSVRLQTQDLDIKVETLAQPLPIAKIPGKSNSASTKQVLTRGGAFKPRPKTPEKLNTIKPGSPIVSPSNLDLDELNLSIKGSENIEIGKPFDSLAAPQMSPKASPGKLKLKDRLTSDLEGMVMDLDTTLETSTILNSDDSIISKTASGLANEFSGQQDSQKSSTYTQTSQSQAAKVTYGASRWTMLPDEDEDMTIQDPIFDSAGVDNADKKSRQLPNFVKSSSKVDPFEMEDDDEEPANTMRSLQELKRAGGNQRISRQAEALLDDIKYSNSKSQKWTSLLELISKLRQSSFLRQFLDAGLETRFLNIVDKKNDLTSKFLYCIALLLVLDNPKLSAVCVVNDASKISVTITSLLYHTSDAITVSKGRSNHIPDDIQKEIDKLRESMRTSPIWPDVRPSVLTPRIVALTCLERLLRKTRAGGSRVCHIHIETIRILGRLLAAWSSEYDNDNFLMMQLSLSALESESLMYSFAEKESIEFWGDDFWTDLTSFYIRLQKSQSNSKYEELLSLSLRLFLNLSNGGPRYYRLFSNIQIIKPVVETIRSLFGRLADKDTADVKQDIVLDNLVLSLGLLINLSENDERIHEIFLQGDKAEDTGLEILICLFLSRVQEVFEVTSEKEARSNVPFGYLAVLLGYLCKSASVFARVRIRLKGGSLRVLLIAIGEFLQYHQKVEDLRPSEGGEQALQEQDIKTTFVNRLQGLMEELQIKEDLIAPAAGKALKAT